MRNLTGKTGWLLVVLATCLVLETTAAGAVQRVGARGGVVVAGFSTGTSDRASDPSVPCFPPTAAISSCESTDPQVSFHMVSVGDTTSCTFQVTVDWGDHTTPTKTHFSGGQNGAVLTLIAHTYAKPASYTISGTGSATGNCYVTAFTLNFTLDPSNKLITSPLGGNIIALTDARYVTGQQTAKQSTPGARGLKVAGHLPCACTMTVNGHKATVSGRTWKVVLPNMRPGPLTITAVAGNGDRQQIEVTLIDLRVVSPSDKQTLPITAGPAMPDLNASLEVAGYPGGVPGGTTFTWTLEAYNRWVTKKKVGKKQVVQWHDGPTKLATGNTIGAGTAWHPQYSTILGGWGHLVVTANLPGVLDGPTTSSPRWFNIPGTNPGSAAVTSFIQAHAGVYADVNTHIACHESHFSQFKTKGQAQMKSTTIPADLPNPAPLRPLFGAPAGIGIMQLDPAAFPDQQWNWQTNVLGGIQLFLTKRPAASAWPGKEQKRIDALRTHDLQVVNAARAKHHLQPITVRRVLVPAYTQDELIRDMLRGYNGYGSGHQFVFVPGYKISPNGLEITVSATPHWALNTKIKPKDNPHYVDTVLNCRP